MTKLQKRKIPKYQTGEKFDFLSELEGGTGDIRELNKTIKIDPFSYEEQKFLPDFKNDNPFFHNMPKKEDEAYKDVLKKDFASDTTSPWASAAGLMKPAVMGFSAWQNWKMLQATKDAAKNIKSPQVAAATVSNRPVQGVDPVIIAQFLKQLGSFRAKKTADQSSNVIADSLNNRNKMAVLDKLSARQIEHLGKERDRHDKIAALNTQAAIKARNEQSKYAVDMFNKKAAIDAQYVKSKQDFFNKFTAEAVEAAEKAAAYNMGKQTIEATEDWNRLQTSVVNAQNRLKMDPTNVTKANELDELLDQQKNLGPTKLPKYSQLMSNLFTTA